MSQALCTGALQVHMLMIEDAGVSLAESCRSREGCQDMWWLCRSVSSLELNYCLTRSSQMWPWIGSVMRERTIPWLLTPQQKTVDFVFLSQAPVRTLPTHTSPVHLHLSVPFQFIKLYSLTKTPPCKITTNYEKDTYPSFLSCFSESLSTHCQCGLLCT